MKKIFPKLSHVFRMGFFYSVVRGNEMKRTFLGAAGFFCALLVCCSAFGSWGIGPLSERVAGADLIVVGKLSDIVERDFSLTYNNSLDYSSKEGRKKAYATHYDRGAITSPKVLKGDIASIGGYVSVAFPSKGQDKHPFRHMLTSHSSGDEGVWLLMQDRVLTGYYFVTGPQNPLPLDSQSEVIKALKETKKK